jgi:hypothetical protein
MLLRWARSVNPLPLNESITSRPACASADAGVKAATKQIAAATHANFGEKRKRTRDQIYTLFMRPLPRSQFRPNVWQEKIFSAYKRSLGDGNSACNPMRGDWPLIFALGLLAGVALAACIIPPT